ncbi:hypothetical protein FNV43_RR27103 [Rhamnella rubrinervis]|uniref:ADP-ribosyl cyclase/cyclic ADP-ribose hydrolase n=1 Tax=Rhamnella rubrinervis TaxID=2594499 RepID=A0A8K0DQL7_9ROSA|nr:hypothetical protein FNV43_RR27103 [Rhamnella rubrinervis]
MATKTSLISSKKYEVFLSFRGEDTRKQFTDHLYYALNQKGIYTFRDDEQLKRGKPISPELLKAIEESIFAVVILSKNYASSSWCLEELSKIVECNKGQGLTIIPVFYHVEPTEVRKQIGNYGEAFAKHQQVFKGDMEKVKRWREALTEVASISGWDIKERHETEVIQEIVKEILKDLTQTFSIGDNELVGMDSRTKKMDLFLDIDLNDIRTIGVWGMGGIGKTTVAREVFRKIKANFDASCFIDNVREEFVKNGILHLQNLLYKNLVLDNEGNIYNYDMGVAALRKRLNSKRVLIILDDVDRLEQIEALVGNAKYQHDWLGPGSRVIVTTRDKHLLKTYGEEYIYEVDKLNYDEALDLLRQKAFKEGRIVDELMELCNELVEYSDGHPLALKVLGCFLFGRSIEEWSDTLAKLKKNPDKDILHTLRISFDGLDDNEKNIFLDIACFFKGESEYRVKKILESCGFYPEIGIQVLIEKSLIIMLGDKLWMHDLLHKLGREIVHQESPEEPGKRSRVWSCEDARHVLVTDTGTEAVQGIFFLGLIGDHEELHLRVNPFEKMKRLRLLRVDNACFPEPHRSLSNELRLLEWHRCPLISLPSSFQPSILVELNLSNSCIERLWKETTIRLEKLILINLTSCKYLKRTPDFSMVPNLERLILEDCKGLSEVHPTIGVLKRLVLLNLKGCESLKSLPRGINLKSLKTFILSGCTNLDKFPEIVGDMDHLYELYLDTTAIKELPISIKRLTGLLLLNLRHCKNLLCLPNEICSLTSLKVLDVSGCPHLEELPENLGSLEQLVELHACRTAIVKVPSFRNIKKLCFAERSSVAVAQRSWQSFICNCFLPKEEFISSQLSISFSGFNCLRSLSLSKCNLSDGAVLDDIGCLSSLQTLDLSENNFMRLPESICQLSNLRELLFFKCSRLESFPKLPLSVRYVNARNCPRLNYSHNRVILWTSTNGFTLIDGNISGNNRMIICDDFAYMFEEHCDSNFYVYFQDLIYCGKQLAMVFPCMRIPEWCSQWSFGSSIRIQLPVENSRETWIGFTLFVAFLTQENEILDGGFHLKETFCSFYTNENRPENPFVVKCFEGLKIGRNGVASIYFPQRKFAKELNKASHIAASVWTLKSDMRVNMCGIHLVFEQDVPDYCRRLVQILGKELNLRSNIKHFKQILKEECTSEDDTNPQKWRNWSSISKSSSSLQQGCRNTTDSNTTSQLRRDLHPLIPLISMLIQGSYAHNYRSAFQFPLKAIPTWFSHQSLGNMTFFDLPPNLFNEKQWVGFSLYAVLTLNSSALDSKTPPLLHIELRCYESKKSFISQFTSVPILYPVSLFHVPRVHFPEQLNRCGAVQAIFRTSTEDVEFEMCGIRIAYEQDLEDVIEMITDIALSSTDEHGLKFCFQAGRTFVKVFTSADECGPQFCYQIPFISDTYPEREYEPSLEEVFSTTQLVHKQFSRANEQLLVPSDLTPYTVVSKGTSKDSESGFTNIQIMAEVPLYASNSKKWQKRLEELLNSLFGYDVVITLILQGHSLSVLKPFNPFSRYDLCFPRKEIMDWFQDYQSSKSRTAIIKLPPNLSTDCKWLGMAVCASFTVHEHPTEFLDNLSSKISFKLLCHLSTEECCLHPAHILRFNKEKFEWLYVGGFIWLIYIPSSLLLPELNGQSCIVVEIYNECTSVITRNVGARLLYQQDVEEFRRSMNRCLTSFFDNMDLIRKFMADEYGNEHHSSGPSVTIQLPSNLYSDGDWLGLALCAYFSELEHPHTFPGSFDSETPHYASFTSDRVVIGANKCGLRLLYRHDEEEFRQTMNHCVKTSLMVDNQKSISDNIELVIEGIQKQYNDGPAATPTSMNKKEWKDPKVSTPRIKVNEFLFACIVGRWNRNGFRLDSTGWAVQAASERILIRERERDG